MTSAVGWLCLDGLEVMNCVRTLTYVDRGLAHSGISGAVTGSCGCSDIDDGDYTSPNIGPNFAPWYTPDDNTSADFLGFVPTSIERRPSLTRAVTGSDFGASVGPLRHGQQFVAVEAIMLASSSRGMEYGERWLRAALIGCDDVAELVMLPACPDGLGLTGFRTLYDVGLVDGPTFSAIQGMPEAFMQDVAFQLVSGTPYAFHDGYDVFSRVPGSTTKAIASTQDWTSDGTLLITVTADESPVVNLHVTGTPAPAASCVGVTGRPCFDYFVPLLPAGHQLVVDGRRRTFEVWNPATQTVEGGMEVLDAAAIFDWPDVAPCSHICVAATADSAGSDSLASVQMYYREP